MLREPRVKQPLDRCLVFFEFGAVRGLFGADDRVMRVVRIACEHDGVSAPHVPRGDLPG